MNAEQLVIQSRRAFAHAVRHAIQDRAAGGYAVAFRVSMIRENAEDNADFPSVERIALRAAERSAWRKDRRNQIKQNGRRWCLRHDVLCYGAGTIPF